MKVIVDVSITPMTGRASVRDEVARAHEILRETNYPVELHANGTNVEGEYSVIMEAIERIHETLHEAGVPRIVTNVRVTSRTDKEDSIQERVESVGRSAFR